MSTHKTRFKRRQARGRTFIRRLAETGKAKPRLSVFRSSQHIYAQIIDDAKGVTIASASTLDAELKEKVKSSANIAAASAVGKLIAQRATSKGISAIVFDRGGYLYHGRVKALAEGAREGGLKF
jgi:large subunit ribosomal protein L18